MAIWRYLHQLQLASSDCYSLSYRPLKLTPHCELYPQGSHGQSRHSTASSIHVTAIQRIHGYKATCARVRVILLIKCCMRLHSWSGDCDKTLGDRLTWNFARTSSFSAANASICWACFLNFSFIFNMVFNSNSTQNKDNEQSDPEAISMHSNERRTCQLLR